MACAVITGAGGGLGRPFALRLAGDGFCVAALDIDGSAAEQTANLVRSAGGRAWARAVDLRDTEDLDGAIAEAERSSGPVAALVNNAAIFPSGPFLDTRRADYDDAIAVNQRAYFFAAQSVAARMRTRGAGAIVNVGSITQHGGWTELASYVSTKGAAAALTRALATELGPFGIRVNCVAPGAFPTRGEDIHENGEAYQQRILNSQALKRRGSAEELAAVVSFLCGPDSSFVTGQTINVDGGWIMS